MVTVIPFLWKNKRRLLVAVLLLLTGTAHSLSRKDAAQMRKNIRQAEAACGDPNVSFLVTPGTGQVEMPALAPGFSRVVIIDNWHANKNGFDPSGFNIDPGMTRGFQKNKQYEQSGSPVVQIGVDGKWVGAVRNNDYFAISVPAGEHHLCVQEEPVLQAFHPTWHPYPPVYLSILSLAEGQTDYFMVSGVEWQPDSNLNMNLKPIQSYTAKLLLSRASPSNISRIEVRR